MWWQPEVISMEFITCMNGIFHTLGMHISMTNELFDFIIFFLPNTKFNLLCICFWKVRDALFFLVQPVGKREHTLWVA